MRRRCVFDAAVVFFLVQGFAPRVKAAPTACIRDNVAGQEARKDGKLHEAQQYLSACSSTACPSVVRADCAAELARVDADMPRIIVKAYDGETETAGVRLSIDDQPVGDRLNGLALDLDPGEHRLKIAAPDGRVAMDSVVLHVGEKDRVVTLRLTKPAPARALVSREETDVRRPIPTATWILGGVAVAAAGGFTFFGLEGRATEDRLGQCAPDCNRPDVTTMRREYLAADISLGVGIVALAAATYFYLAQPKKGR